jgi:hypothetical protein
MDSALLAQSRLSMVTRLADSELARIHDVLEHKVLVDGRGDVEAVLGRLLACDGPRAPKTLDLIGHSTPSSCLLQLGEWVIDATSPTVTAFFRELADLEVLPRLGIHAVRLLGCKTAETAQARATICALSDILGVEVYGTSGLVFSAHYDALGFQNAWRFLLIGSSDLRLLGNEGATQVRPEADPRSLDVDSLPVASLGDSRRVWPIRIANEHAARGILRLVRRGEGAQMPGLLATPSCEIALPSTHAGLYHRLQILLDGQFVRAYFDESRHGVLYPVSHPEALCSLIEQLPTG